MEGRTGDEEAATKEDDDHEKQMPSLTVSSLERARSEPSREGSEDELTSNSIRKTQH